MYNITISPHPILPTHNITISPHPTLHIHMYNVTPHPTPHTHITISPNNTHNINISPHPTLHTHTCTTSPFHHTPHQLPHTSTIPHHLPQTHTPPPLGGDILPHTNEVSIQFTVCPSPAQTVTSGRHYPFLCLPPPTSRMSFR